MKISSSTILPPGQKFFLASQRRASATLEAGSPPSADLGPINIDSPCDDLTQSREMIGPTHVCLRTTDSRHQHVVQARPHFPRGHRRWRPRSSPRRPPASSPPAPTSSSSSLPPGTTMTHRLRDVILRRDQAAVLTQLIVRQQKTAHPFLRT